jgi:hypothetical protein
MKALFIALAFLLAMVGWSLAQEDPRIDCTTWEGWRNEHGGAPLLFFVSLGCQGQALLEDSFQVFSLVTLIATGKTICVADQRQPAAHTKVEEAP